MTAGADLDCENEEIPDPEAEEESGKMCRRGLKPIDYVNDNEQVLICQKLNCLHHRGFCF